MESALIKGIIPTSKAKANGKRLIDNHPHSMHRH